VAGDDRAVGIVVEGRHRRIGEVWIEHAIAIEKEHELHFRPLLKRFLHAFVSAPRS